MLTTMKMRGTLVAMAALTTVAGFARAETWTTLNRAVGLKVGAISYPGAATLYIEYLLKGPAIRREAVPLSLSH